LNQRVICDNRVTMQSDGHASQNFWHVGTEQWFFWSPQIDHKIKGTLNKIDTTSLKLDIYPQIQKKKLVMIFLQNHPAGRAGWITTLYQTFLFSTTIRRWHWISPNSFNGMTVRSAIIDSNCRVPWFQNN
jgi:hypothetical protein